MRARPHAVCLSAVLALAAPAWAAEPEPAKSPPPAEASAKPRYRVSSAEAPRHGIAQGKGAATLLLNPSTGATAASLTLLEFQPGATVPEHTHATSAELLYVEEGSGELVVEGQVLRVGPGDAVYIPAGAKHSAKVSSEGPPLRLVQVYAGPGPELRFTHGPRLKAPRAPEAPGEQTGARPSP